MKSLAELPIPDREFESFYAGYINHVPEADLFSVLRNQPKELSALFENVEDEQFAYAAGKWTFREVAGHLCDAERVFGYRVFCIARGERKNLPGFDENRYIETSGYNELPLSHHLKQFALLRESNLMVLEVLKDAQFQKRGWANGKRISVRALIRIMAGHVRHHEAVMRERYF